MFTKFKFKYRWPNYIWETESLSISFEWYGREVNQTIPIKTEEVGETFVRFFGINPKEVFNLKRSKNLCELKMSFYNDFSNCFETYYIKKSLVEKYAAAYFDPTYKRTMEHGDSWRKINDNS